MKLPRKKNIILGKSISTVQNPKIFDRQQEIGYALKNWRIKF
jgi:hypothetical protein